MRPAAKDQYDEAAKYHLDEANKNLTNQSYGAAYREAQEFAECAIKAVLNKKRPLTKGETSHYCWDLWEKIKKEDIISKTEVDTLDPLVSNILETDISSDTDHIDCAPTGSLQTGRLRYVNPSSYVSKNDAEEKVALANDIWKTFSKYM
jgi:HEPN domain-containing protein